jgi:uncharacterized protein YcfJ
MDKKNMSEKVKFIRKNGKLIPIKEKKDGNVDKRHVSNKELLKSAERMKPKAKNQKIGALAGGVAGTLIGLKKGTLIEGAIGGLLGGLAGRGLGSIRYQTKQEVANKLKKVKEAKKN